LHGGGWRRHESFLLLFFKKEVLSLLIMTERIHAMPVAPQWAALQKGYSLASI
jgi:hypothetical protein